MRSWNTLVDEKKTIKSATKKTKNKTNTPSVRQETDRKATASASGRATDTTKIRKRKRGAVDLVVDSASATSSANYCYGLERYNPAASKYLFLFQTSCQNDTHVPEYVSQHGFWYPR